MGKLTRGIEIERKLIIAKPDIALLESMADYKRSEIEQIYLLSEGNVTHRVRRRKTGDLTRYYETRKTRIDKMSVIEEEGEISAEEYQALADKIDPETRPIYKVRHAFSYGDRVVEIDVYPEWERTAILEVELGSREEELALPDFIEVKKEVTGVRGYSNAAMSRKFPDEVE